LTRRDGCIGLAHAALERENVLQRLSPLVVLKRTAILFYCIAIFLALDFVVSTVAPNLIGPMQTPSGNTMARIRDPILHHNLATRFEGIDSWGETRYRVVTNSLGFKDATTREVPLKSDTYRILLIGDSFTESVGVEYPDTWAGLLYRAGQEHTPKIEFLNAGLGSYSPTIYYAKVKHLIEIGLKFDEVVVLPDLSDIQDEAWFYFCYDEIPEYRAHCDPTKSENYFMDPRAPTYLQKHFMLTDRLRVLLKQRLRSWSGNQKRLILTPNSRTAWVFPGYDLDAIYTPLGVDGAIKRATRHMQALADLLAAHHIPLTVAVYPWPVQLAQNDRDSREIKVWRDFCRNNCKAFINLYPDIFAAKDAHPDWYERYFFFGDDHYSAEGNHLFFHAIEPHLLPKT
jgi:hypothetical protein